MNRDEKTSDVSHIPASERSYIEEVKASHVDEVEPSATDPEKQDVVKSDDSDGHVVWSWGQILATLSLCCLYVGACTLVLVPKGQKPCD
jgi:hypothetical protein